MGHADTTYLSSTNKRLIYRTAHSLTRSPTADSHLKITAKKTSINRMCLPPRIITLGFPEPSEPSNMSRALYLSPQTRLLTLSFRPGARVTSVSRVTPHLTSSRYLNTATTTPQDRLALQGNLSVLLVVNIMNKYTCSKVSVTKVDTRQRHILARTGE